LAVDVVGEHLLLALGIDDSDLRLPAVLHALEADHLALRVVRNRVDAGYLVEEDRKIIVLVDLGDGVARPGW
jgi:hypothetical protein